MEDFEQQLMFYSSVLEVPAAAEGATYKCEATLEVETDTFRQSRMAVVNSQTTQVPSTTEEATFALVTERTSRVATLESAITEPPATTQGLPLLSTEPPTTTSTASPTPEPLPETSSLSPTRNPVAAVQTSSQNSGTGANTVQVPVLTSTETPATSQPPRLTDEPPTTAPVPATASSLATRAAEKPHSSSATTDPSRDPCRPVITPVPTQGSTGGTLQITCLTADCGKDVQVRWVETPVAKSRYRQEEAEGRSTLVVESVSLEHQGVYRCVAIASQPRMASLTISIVPNGEYTGAPCPLILASAKALLPTAHRRLGGPPLLAFWIPRVSVLLFSCVHLFVTPWTRARQALLSSTASRSLVKLMLVASRTLPHHLVLCPPLLLVPSIFPNIRVFPRESSLLMRWPKSWSFGICPSSEHSGLISFRMERLDLLAVRGTLKSLLQHQNSKASILWRSAFFMVQLSLPYITTGKTIA
uniref:Ig-like domain-containing protein n=1 Tax=Podarcis muralis TaxID=64176 RepID=A0A670KKT1_PODMU